MKHTFDRIPQFDERSRSFSIASVLPTKTPRSYTWRCNEWHDQGNQGACVAFALAHELCARPSEVKGLSFNWITDLYYDAQRNDPWPGGAYPGASPYYDGTSVLSGVKALQKQGWFDSYRWAFGLNELILGLGRNGPAVIGINWHEGMFEPDQDGYIHVTGDIVGGHAVLVRSVNIAKKRLTIRNSWGQQWGQSGDCYISFSDMDQLLKAQGEAVFLLGRKSSITAHV